MITFDKAMARESFFEMNNQQWNNNAVIINAQRLVESPDATVSSFIAYGRISYANVIGYFLEPGGPSTTTPNQDKRIPAGSYNIEPYSSNSYPNNFRIYNDFVSKERKILIHSGNYHYNTLGCLLPGNSYSMSGENYAVWNSGSMMNSLRILFNGRDVILNILDITKPQEWDWRYYKY